LDSKESRKKERKTRVRSRMQRQKWKEVSGWLEKNGDLESHDISDMKKQIHMYKFSKSFTT
jgi:hypothetical protein